MRVCFYFEWDKLSHSIKEPNPKSQISKTLLACLLRVGKQQASKTCAIISLGIFSLEFACLTASAGRDFEA
jgi:hypothetical protein